MLAGDLYLRQERFAQRTPSGTTRNEDAEIAIVAGMQHGVIATRQLKDLGLESPAISRRVKRGWLHPIRHSVYAVGHRKLTPDGEEIAALAACGDGAALSHRSAGHLWGLLPNRPHEVDVTIGRHRDPRGVDVHRIPLDRRDVTTRQGRDVTKLGRTLADLATELSEPELTEVIRRADVRKLLTPPTVRAAREASRGRKGGALLRRLLEPKPSMSRSVLERRVAEFLDRSNLPDAERDVYVEIDGRLHEKDAIWRAEMIAIEIDSREFHDDEDAFVADRAKDRIFQAAGWLTPRITADDLKHPVELELQLQRMLDRRRAVDRASEAA